MQISIPTADLKSALNTALAGALSVEQSLGQTLQAQLAALVEELYPLVVSETQALITAANPAIPRTYLAVLEGCVAATIAKLSLAALEEQRNILASTLHGAVQILALVLRAAVVA